MASFSRKRGKEVCVYVFKNGKSVQLPRSLTRHLDHEPDHNIDFWIKNYELVNGLTVPRATTPDLTRYVEQYATFLATRGIVESTIAEHVRHLTQSVIPYFLSLTPPMEDPNNWASASIKMHRHLESRNLTSSQIFRCNISLRKFHRWLAEENLILGSGTILLRNPVQEIKTTPLKTTLLPDAVLEKITKELDPDFVLMLLGGYFMSLRPQEIFGLKVGDFRAGRMVEVLECAKAASSTGLYSKLAVNIVRQRTKQMKVVPPKAGSGVGCLV